jgi:hypothetical protein
VREEVHEDEIAKDEKPETSQQDAIVCEDLPTEGVHGEDSVFEESVCEEVEEDPKKSKEAKVPVEAKSSVEKDQDEEEPSLAVASCDEQLGEHKREEGKSEDVASRDLKVAVVRLKDGDRRGLWSDEVHELPKIQSIQAIAHDAASDVELPLLLDIETNISTLHTNLARRLSVDVRMFAIHRASAVFCKIQLARPGL